MISSCRSRQACRLAFSQNTRPNKCLFQQLEAQRQAGHAAFGSNRQRAMNVRFCIRFGKASESIMARLVALAQENDAPPIRTGYERK
jgi:hypothetical protein